MTRRATPDPDAVWPPRRVALVHDWLNGMRGGEKVFEVFCELFPHADVHTLFYEPDRVSERIRAMNVHESPLARVPGARRRYRWLLPILPLAAERIPTRDYDLVISTSHCVVKSVLPPRNGLHICYCFTPMRYIWDQFPHYFPRGEDPAQWIARVRRRDWQGLGQSVAARLTREAMRIVRGPLQNWDRGTAHRADAFIADSANVAAKIATYYKRAAAVIYPPVDTDFHVPGDPRAIPIESFTEENDRALLREIQTNPEPYYLVVAALVPYKRIDRAMEAARLGNRRLLIIGDGPERPRLEAAAPEGTRFFGWLGNEALRAAYQGARALLYPGEEDFGITALESQACGRPVIALAKGGALETVRHGETGLHYEDPSPRGLLRALEELEARSFSPEACRTNALRFSRDNFRRQCEDYFRTAWLRRA